MKITLSKVQWEEMGKKAGWVKEAQVKAQVNLSCRFTPIDNNKKYSGEELVEPCGRCKLREMSSEWCAKNCCHYSLTQTCTEPQCKNNHKLFGII